MPVAVSVSDSVAVFACSCANFVLVTLAGQFVNCCFLNNFVFQVADIASAVRLISLLSKALLHLRELLFVVRVKVMAAACIPSYYFRIICTCCYVISDFITNAQPMNCLI